MILRTFDFGGKVLALRKRGEVLDLVLGNVVLLSSAALETELDFGRLASTEPGAKILIGGLGFGSTLRGALEVAAKDSKIVVVEKLAPVIDLARAESAHLVAGALEDPRVELVNDDVADVIASSTDLSSILLDVDNGPDWASFRTNARLYSPAALAQAIAAMSPSGRYAVWSGYAADGFVGVLRRAGLEPSVVPLHERGVVRARAYIGKKAAVYRPVT